jgi:hypothetical protein
MCKIEKIVVGRIGSRSVYEAGFEPTTNSHPITKDINLPDYHDKNISNGLYFNSLEIRSHDTLYFQIPSAAKTGAQSNNRIKIPAAKATATVNGKDTKAAPSLLGRPRTFQPGAGLMGASPQSAFIAPESFVRKNGNGPGDFHFFKEVARGGEQTRSLSISFIFSFSPPYL